MPEKSSSSVRVFYPRHSAGQVVEHLRAKLPAIQAIVPVKVFALFGSYARGNYTAASDVDVLLVYEGPPRDDAYRLIRAALNLPGSELHLYSEEEYQAVKPTVDRMLRTSIPIARGD